MVGFLHFIMPENTQKQYEKERAFWHEVQQCSSLLILPHTRPDGDSFGSSIAFAELCRAHNKHCDIASLDTEIIKSFEHFTGVEVLQKFDPTKYDGLVTIDHSEIKRAGYAQLYPDLGRQIPNHFFIDHHPLTPQSLRGCPHLLDTHSSATAVIMYRLYCALGITPSELGAKGILTGIYTDTYSFHHGNSIETFRAAHDMSVLFPQYQAAMSHIFGTDTRILRLWGYIFEHIRITKDNILIASITQDDLERLDCTEADIDDQIINNLNTINGPAYVLFVYQKKNGIKFSMRVQKDSNHNASQIAQMFGGGGHEKSAGFMIPGRLTRHGNAFTIESDREEQVW